MTVWLVILNNITQGVYASRESAREGIEQLKKSFRLKPGPWIEYPTNPDSWHSPNVTNLHIEEHIVHE